MRRPLKEVFLLSNQSNDHQSDKTSKERSVDKAEESGREVDKDKDDEGVVDLQVGQNIAAIYNNQWYIAVVEGEEPEEETEGFTLLKYMKRCGENKFLWEEHDELKTNNVDILKKINPPIPVSNRLL